MSDYIRLEKDADGIVDLILDQPGKPVNTMGYEYIDAIQRAVTALESMVADGGIKGVYIRSGKKTFFGGGDLTSLVEMPTELTPEEATDKFESTMAAKLPLRRLETLGVPVAAGINGAALGGGYEICLACHYRVAIDAPGVEVGLPEAKLGLMPGAGGVARMVRMFGCQAAITWISAGKKFRAKQALEKGWVDEVAHDESDMHVKAKAWLLANPDAKQPWDEEGFTIPGGVPNDKGASQALQGLLYFGPVSVMNSTLGNFPAARAIFACVNDVARVDFDTAEKIESRYFAKLMTSQVAKNMIRTFFFQLNDINNGTSRPQAVPKTDVRKLGILGAGQMGSGIAFAAAKAGIEVVLKDISLDNAERGKGYCRQICEKNKRVSEAQAEVLLARIVATASYDELENCDFVIEAVFEDREIKARVTGEIEAAVSAQSIIASNTSALPITELSRAASRPENFIGMHFFSPVEKMPLVEIICGEKSSDEALAKAFDLTLKLRKTPIVVNDAPGFFTTRVISATISEGAAMVLEGIDPVLIERAARLNGSPVGPLAAIDEISQETAYKNSQQMKVDTASRGAAFPENAAAVLVARMVEEFGRRGKAHGGGYYEYPEDGRKFIWPGLKEHFAPNGYRDVPLEDIRDRLSFCQSIEAVRAMEEGVIERVADGNIGSIFGIGFAPNTGGVFQFINAYGVQEFVDRSEALAAKYGPQFSPPALLMEKARSGELFI